MSFHRPIGGGRGIRRLAAAPDLVEFKLLGKFVIGMEALEGTLVQEGTATINTTEKAAALARQYPTRDVTLLEQRIQDRTFQTR